LDTSQLEQSQDHGFACQREENFKLNIHLLAIAAQFQDQKPSDRNSLQGQGNLLSQPPASAQRGEGLALPMRVFSSRVAISIHRLRPKTGPGGLPDKRWPPWIHTVAQMCYREAEQDPV